MKENFAFRKDLSHKFQEKEKLESKFTYLFIATQSPALLGVYDEHGKLVCAQQISEQASEALPAAFAELAGVYAPRRLVYTHTPGSFMALKIAYCFFATAAVALGAKLAGVSAFAFVPVVRANAAAAFVPALCKEASQTAPEQRPGATIPRAQLLPLLILRQQRPEFFAADGSFVPPKAELPADLAPFEQYFIADAKPDYCVNAF